LENEPTRARRPSHQPGGEPNSSRAARPNLRRGLRRFRVGSAYGLATARPTQSSTGRPPWHGAGARCRTRVPGLRDGEPQPPAELSAGHDAEVPVRGPAPDRPSQAPPPKLRAAGGLLRAGGRGGPPPLPVFTPLGPTVIPKRGFTNPPCGYSQFGKYDRGRIGEIWVPPTRPDLATGSDVRIRARSFVVLPAARWRGQPRRPAPRPRLVGGLVLRSRRRPSRPPGSASRR
jgi:hypothetical protein